MASAKVEPYGVRYGATHQSLFIEGDDARDEMAGWGLDRMTGAGFFLPLDVASPIRLSSLRRALLAAIRAGTAGSGFDGYVELERDASFLISTADLDEFDSKHSPPHDVVIELLGDRLLGCVHLEFMSENWTPRSVEETVEPLLSSLDATFFDCGEYGEVPFAGNPWLWAVRFSLDWRGKTVADVIELGVALQDVLLAVDRGELDAGTGWGLARAGRASSLYGQPESNWLEVKTLGWDLSTDAGKIELAQDVARFGNGDGDGLMLVGIATKKESGSEVLVRGPGLQFTAKDVQRHHQVIDARVYPPLQGLIVEAVPDGRGGELLAFWVPAQPEELKPFLVHGAIIGHKMEGAFISVVRRRGEHSIADTPQALHAQIAAGRALLRPGYSLKKDNK
jgi:hypothetical protein